MNIGIIGAGRVGSAMALALKSKGQTISGIYSRTQKSQQELSRQLGGIYPNDLRATVEKSDVIIVAVPDDSIEEVADEICVAVQKGSLAEKVIFHTSGAKSDELLEACRELGAAVGSLHMLMTFPEKEKSWERVFQALMSVQGDEAAVETAIQIAGILEVNLWEIKSKEDKTLYHVAACVLSNYTVTVMQIACEIFAMMGLNEKDGLEAYTPLLEASIKNALAMGPINALTGPIRRGDISTIKEHLNELRFGPDIIKDVYTELGIVTARLAEAYGYLPSHRTMEVIDTFFDDEEF